MNKKIFNQQNGRFWAFTLLISFLICIAMVVLYVVFHLLCNIIIWTGNEPLYYPLQLLKNLAPYIVVSASLGFIIFRLIMLNRHNQKNMELLLAATKSIYENETRSIELPEDLVHAEFQLNEIRAFVREKERQARQAEQQKNDLVVYLAHDMKTPLTSVLGYLTLLCDEPDISPEFRNRYLNIVRNKTEHLEDLINEFFDITRFNLTTIELELESINISRMLEQMLFEFQPLFVEKNLHYKLNAPSDIALLCDPQKLERVFENLFRNAIHYSYPQSEIQVVLTQKNSHVEIRVINHGKTIPPEKLSRLFDRFYRVDKSRSTSAGAGLGLAIAKQIVEKHNGTIVAESENESICFTINLPVD